MDKNELLKNAVEEVKDAINILQLLMVELTKNQDDGHIIRSVNVTEKMLQRVLSNLQQIKED